MWGRKRKFKRDVKMAMALSEISQIPMTESVRKPEIGTVVFNAEHHKLMHLIDLLEEAYELSDDDSVRSHLMQAKAIIKSTLGQILVNDARVKGGSRSEAPEHAETPGDQEKE